MKPANTLAEELLEGPLAYFDFQGQMEKLTEAIEEDRNTVLKEVVAISCPECRDGDESIYDPEMKHYYHYEGSLGCRASLIHRMIEERQPTGSVSGNEGQADG